jgi:predicted transcriptional regulator
MSRLVEITAEFVSAYVSHNSVPTFDLPRLIVVTGQTVETILTGKSAEAKKPLVPAVPIKKSIHPNYIISLEDGRKFKSMKRYLGLLGMTPDEYRTKWGLPKDYPMVAPNYSAQRSELAKQMGLGTKRVSKTSRRNRKRR